MSKKHKNYIYSESPRCPILKFFVVTGEVFLHFLALMLAPVNLFSILPPSRELCIMKLTNMMMDDSDQVINTVIIII